MAGKPPKVTVLMPVYNGEKYLAEAMESILNQTFTDFEFLIIDDGSFDNSVHIIKSYSDRRIKLMHNGTNLGLVATLNKGLDLASGEYVARMDSDDISLPHRLERQVEYMDSHPDIGVSGTWYESFGAIKGRICLPTQYEIIQSMLFFNSYLAHPSVIMRLSSLNQHGLRYNPAHIHAEDYGLWIECSFRFPIVNVPETLLKYRVTPTSVSRVHQVRQRQTVLEIHKDNLNRLGVDDYDEETLKIHENLLYFDKDFADRQYIAKTIAWLKRLREANQIAQCYPEPFFSNLLTEKEEAICGRRQDATQGEQVVYADCAQTDTGKVPVIVYKKCNIEWDIS